MKTLIVRFNKGGMNDIAPYRHVDETIRFAIGTNLDLRVGDIVKDKGFNSKYTIVEVLEEDYDTYKCVGKLGIASPYTINDIPAQDLLVKRLYSMTNSNSNNVEKKTIEVTLTQAREWYNSDNDALKTLAISTFGEDKLVDTLDTIIDSIGISYSICTTYKNGDKQATLAKLAMIAEYLNGDWQPSNNSPGYFIAKIASYKEGSPSYIDNKARIVAHSSVLYPGIVYFKSDALARKAYHMLSELDKLLLLE